MSYSDLDGLIAIASRYIVSQYHLLNTSYHSELHVNKLFNLQQIPAPTKLWPGSRGFSVLKRPDTVELWTQKLPVVLLCVLTEQPDW